MKKFKSLFVVAAAVLFGFSSCLDGDVTTGNAYHDGNVRLQLQLPPTTLTVGPSQAAAPVAILNGTVIFTTSAGVIQNVFPIHPAGAPDGVTITDLGGSGHTFNAVSALATQVHFIGNTTITATLVEGITNISAVLNQVLPVTGQAELDDNNQVVNVYGMGLISAGAVSIEVEPTVARVEIHRITGDETIASFTVHGIFMDRYFPTANLDGRLIPFVNNDPLIRSWGGTACVALFNWPGSTHATLPPFELPMRGPIFDWSDSGNDWIGGNVGPVLDLTPAPGVTFPAPQHRQTVYPGAQPALAGPVWGYNLFANYSNVARDLGSQFPLVIIRMTNVTIRQRVYEVIGGVNTFRGYEIVLHPEHDGVATNPVFVTIRGFAPQGEVPLNVDNGFLPRRVYQIGTTDAGWFGKDAVRRVPNEQPINVNVTVVPLNWILRPGTPVVTG